MELIISGRGLALSRSLKDVVTRKVAKLDPLLPTVTEARATFTAEKFRKTVRLILSTRGRVFSASATDGDLMAAVDTAVESLAHQVRRAKERRRLARRRMTRAVQGRRPAGEVA